MEEVESSAVAEEENSVVAEEESVVEEVVIEVVKVDAAVLDQEPLLPLTMKEMKFLKISIISILMEGQPMVTENNMNG